VSLLLRMNAPTGENIYIDGFDISEWDFSSLRRQIGIVQQDVLMFSGTIRFNILLGRKDSTDGEIMEACERANIADFIRSLPDGLDTVIGRDGINLSGGQKQRISIARIFLRNPKIIIFDEATSALDYESENAVNQAWLELSKNKTSIVISHRLSSIINTDKVAVIQNGEIVAFDHHKKLFETCGPYRELFYLQYMGRDNSS